ncbi:MAG: recombination regulator RecX [Firmicutes bacterium]|nr:recombination regulator RecX [Bacillota bacterium]
MKSMEDKGLEYALYLLSLQMRSENGLVEKLLSKGYEPHVVEAIIERLKEAGVVDDVAFASAYIRGRRSKYGDYRIKMELVRKGIDAKTIETAYFGLEEEEDLHDPYQMAKAVLEKKIAATTIEWDRLNTDYKYKMSVYQKLTSFLAGRGFSSGVVKQVISERLRQEFLDEF